MKFDVVIIGAGAVGCAIARSLSYTNLSVAVLEKECDVAFGTSGRNSAVCHAGFNNKTGSLMAKFCVQGNKLMQGFCQELDVPYKKTGKYLVGFDEEDMKTLELLVEKGRANGCTGLELVGADEVRKAVPGVGGIGAMKSPNTAIFDTFGYTIALAENALANGCHFFFNTPVEKISKGGETNRFIINNTFECKVLINSSGLHSDTISALAGVPNYKIYPCKGQYFIFDTIADEYLGVPIYPAPRKGIGGLGIHLTPTIHGNIIAGPSADYLDDPADTSTTAPVLDTLLRESSALLPSLSGRKIIGSYAGIRPKQAPPSEGGFRDFTIVSEPSCKGLINLIGIESPGLTASVPIAEYVLEILKDHQKDFGLSITSKDNPIRTRKGILRFANLSFAQRAELIAQNPDYGEVVCRCQTITLAEIKQAVDNPLGAISIASIKGRAWPTTGRCQGGYCLARIVDILLAKGLEPKDINWRSNGSSLFEGVIK